MKSPILNCSSSNLIDHCSLEHIIRDCPLTNEGAISKKYTTLNHLGSGAYANVKYATCCKSGNPFALKIISKTKPPKEYLRKFVPREVEALKRLSVHNHPMVCQMREFFETRDRVYLVMNLAKGGDLLSYINSRKYLNEDTSRKMAAQILCALDHIHDLGIVHRDLKCENLLIGPGYDDVMISDFGFATLQPKNKLLTTFCGSYAYAAPEILNGNKYNGRMTDVWSVGVVLYAMLNGRLPFNETKPKNILAKIKTSPLVMIRQTSISCENFVKTILTINPDDRPCVSQLLLKRWLENPLKKILKTLPEKDHPSCFRLNLPYKSSFRMSDSSDECLKVFSSGEDTTSLNVPIKITTEFIAKNSSSQSINTTSTISERMKRKYRQIKSDLKTWASKKRRDNVESHNYRDEHARGAYNRRSVRNYINTPSKLLTTRGDRAMDPVRKASNLPVSVPVTKKKPNSYKYAMRNGSSRSVIPKKILEFATREQDTVRAVSATPPTTRQQKPLLESRAKSGKVKPLSVSDADQATEVQSGNTGRRSSANSKVSANNAVQSQKYHQQWNSNTKPKSSISKNSGSSSLTRRGSSGAGSVEDKVNEQIVQYLAQQRDLKNHLKNKEKVEYSVCLGSGLPPLDRNIKRGGTRRKKRKSKSTSMTINGNDRTITVSAKHPPTTQDTTVLMHDSKRRMSASRRPSVNVRMGNNCTQSPNDVVMVNRISPNSPSANTYYRTDGRNMGHRKKEGSAKLSKVYN